MTAASISSPGPRRELAGSDYRGAVLFESVAGSGGPYRQLVANLRATPHFQTLTALPDIADLEAPWAVWDETTTLDLQLWTEDSLESLTEQEVLAGHNLLLIGRELVQFVTATSLGSGRWRIARLLRGRYGTERLMTGHRAFEPGFVVERSLMSRAGGLDSRNLERWYKAVALGFDAGGVIPERFTNSSGALLPWAPCQVRADRIGRGPDHAFLAAPHPLRRRVGRHLGGRGAAERDRGTLRDRPQGPGRLRERLPDRRAGRGRGQGHPDGHRRQEPDADRRRAAGDLSRMGSGSIPRPSPTASS